MHKSTHNYDEEFEWDRKKAVSNLKKHGVHFADAVAVLEDEMAITILNDHPYEERLITVGEDTLGRILVVICTIRETRIRIISARKATTKEIRQYKGL